MNAIRPQTLLEASDTTLGSMELAALAQASNLGKAIREEMFLWAEEYARAMTVRWMREHRRELLAQTGQEGAPEKVFDVLSGG